MKVGVLKSKDALTPVSRACCVDPRGHAGNEVWFLDQHVPPVSSRYEDLSSSYSWQKGEGAFLKTSFF